MQHLVEYERFSVRRGVGEVHSAWSFPIFTSCTISLHALLLLLSLGDCGEQLVSFTVDLAGILNFL
jgi:hypothetical protein